jgi:hypothetical protein
VGRPKAALPLEHHQAWKDREVSQALAVGKPWLVWLAALPTGIILHYRFAHWWAAAMVGAACALLAFGSLMLARKRSSIHAVLLVPASWILIGTWLAWVTMAGITPPGSPQSAVWFILGGAGCAWWSRWLHSHATDDDHHAGSIKSIFAEATVIGGAEGARVISSRALDPGTEGVGIEAHVEHPPGWTHDDFSKQLPNITAAAHLPPGSLTAVPDRRDGARSRLALTNPMLLDRPLPWPGASLPGASIAEPITTGLHVNGRPARWVVVNHSSQYMGKTGSGKSFGGWWNEAAECMTRHDWAGMGVDITKADQTFGPMRAGLHRVETTRDGVADLLEGVHRAIPARTAFLTRGGYNRWVEGCGLKFLTVDLEETPDIVNMLDDAELLQSWLSDIKAIRSAGGRFIVSLQRSTFDQLPPVVRSQLTKFCYGLEDADDETYGMSERQQRGQIHPSEWGQNFPGRHLLDPVDYPQELAVMEARNFAWGDAAKDGGLEGSQMMRHHSAAYPASARPLDDCTLAAMATPVIASSVPPPAAPPADPVAAPSSPLRLTGLTGGQPQEPIMRHHDDPDDPGSELDTDLRHHEPDIDPAGLGGSDWTFEPPEEQPALSPEEAMGMLVATLERLRHAGHGSISLDDLESVRTSTGRSVAWLYDAMNRLETQGKVKQPQRRTRPRTWLIAA